MPGEIAHSHIGPSSAHRWMNCAASVAFITKLDLWGDEGEEAARGTVAHFVCSECLSKSMEPYEFAGQTYKQGQYEFTVDEDMVVACESFIALVHSTMAKYADKNPILYVERRVSSDADPEAFGTSDVVIEVPSIAIIILDFKHGMVVVEPSDEQLKLYGQYSYERRSQAMRGAGETKNIVLVIHQPRAAHPSGPTRVYATTADDLQKWMDDEVVPAIKETRNPNATFVQGDWCKYCPALAHCKLWQDTMAKIPIEMADRTSVLSDEQISYFRSLKKRATKFFEAVDKEAYQRVIVQGKKIDGCKPVHKLGDRVWKPEMLMDDPENPGGQITVSLVSVLEEKYGAKAYPDRKIKSPAQIERLPGGKALTAQWAYKPTTGLTLADEDDVREPAVGLMNMADEANAKAAVEPVVV